MIDIEKEKEKLDNFQKGFTDEELIMYYHAEGEKGETDFIVEVPRSLLESFPFGFMCFIIQEMVCDLLKEVYFDKCEKAKKVGIIETSRVLTKIIIGDIILNEGFINFPERFKELESKLVIQSKYEPMTKVNYGKLYKEELDFITKNYKKIEPNKIVEQYVTYLKNKDYSEKIMEVIKANLEEIKRIIG